MAADDDILQGAYTLAIAHFCAYHVVYMQMLISQWIEGIQIPFIAPGCQLAFPDCVTPLGVVVTDSQYLEAQYGLQCDVVTIAVLVRHIDLR